MTMSNTSKLREPRDARNAPDSIERATGIAPILPKATDRLNEQGYLHTRYGNVGRANVVE